MNHVSLILQTSTIENASDLDDLSYQLYGHQYSLSTPKVSFHIYIRFFKMSEREKPGPNIPDSMFPNQGRPGPEL
jgi:hypothetical protein